MKKPVLSDALANAFHRFAATLPRANGVRAVDGEIWPEVIRTCGGTRRRRNGRMTVRERQLRQQRERTKAADRAQFEADCRRLAESSWWRRP